MGSRLKEDERNEKTIRSLLKLSENRRCINCASLGPQYVCTTFSIFVCTNCSGLHREFTHRIKSVSMAKFTADEVRNLQAGGNERGREVFLKDFDFQRNLPDSSNPEKLREFIKSVYVERRYTGERPPLKGRQGDREDPYEARRPELRPDPRSDARGDYRPDSRSPPFEDRHDDRRFVERRRSDADRGRHDDRTVRFEEKRSPARFEPDRSRYDQKNHYDERRHEDRSRLDAQEDRIRYDERDRERDRDRRASYDERFANETRHDRRRSADDRLSFKDFDGDSPPVRPVTEILGNNVPALWVEEYRQTNGRDEEDRSSTGSPAEQRRDTRVPRLGSFGSANGAASVQPSVAVKRVNSGSLIDFSAEPEPAVAPPAAAAIPAADLFGVSAVVTPQAAAVSTSSTGWATFDTAPVATTKVHSEGPPTGYPDVFSNGSTWSASGWPTTQAPSIPTTDNWSSLIGATGQQAVMSAGSQQWKPFPVVSEAPPLQPGPPQLQPGPGLVQEQVNTSSGQLATLGSRELPKELFSNSFSNMGIAAGGLGRPPHNQGFTAGVQPYGVVGTMPNYAPAPRSRNPFDLPGDVTPSMGIGSFPSMGSLQANLPTRHGSLPASVAPASSNQWSMDLQPASYPPIGPSGGSGSSFISQLNHSHSAVMSVPTSGSSLGSSDSGTFNGLFASDPTPMGSGSLEFPAQNFVRPLGGNPFV